MKRYIGIDLHTNSFTCCFLQEDGKERVQTWPLQGGGLEQSIKGPVARWLFFYAFPLCIASIRILSTYKVTVVAGYAIVIRVKNRTLIDYRLQNRSGIK